MDIEFWSLKRVLQAVGLSKSEIYRQISDGRFPGSRAYLDNPHKKFWLSTEIRQWQRRQIGDDFEALLG